MDANTQTTSGHWGLQNMAPLFQGLPNVEQQYSNKPYTPPTAPHVQPHSPCKRVRSRRVSKPTPPTRQKRSRGHRVPAGPKHPASSIGHTRPSGPFIRLPPSIVKVVRDFAKEYKVVLKRRFDQSGTKITNVEAFRRDYFECKVNVALPNVLKDLQQHYVLSEFDKQDQLQKAAALLHRMISMRDSNHW